jgi:ATP-binding cassette subfamily B protein/subfamily B ATP-binding cassette protein MsbA
MKSGVVIAFVMSAGTTILYLVGSIQVLNQALTIGGVLVFVAYLTQLYQPIEQLSGIAGTLAGASTSLARSFEIIDQHHDHERDASLPSIRIQSGEIRLSDVSFTYPGGSPVLSNLNLTVHPGETLAVVGETGQGKSTILSLLTRFYEPDRGTIYIDNQSISSFAKSSLRSAISVVLQDTVLFSTSIAENIRYGRADASLADVKEAATRAEAYDFIMKLPQGFDTQIGERGGRLSGGQRQRIAIARAFLRDTPILLLDEPTSALDTITETRISHALYELMKLRTTLLVTHRLALASRADKVAVLHQGMIVEMGHPDELRKEGGYFAALLANQVNPS